MIGIFQNQELTSDKRHEIEEWHYQVVQKLLQNSRLKTSSGKNVNDLLQYLESTLHIQLKDLILANYKELINVKSKVNDGQINEFQTNTKKPLHFFVKVYATYRKSYGWELVKKLGLTVCPYCNRNFINNTSRCATAQFDHFFPKIENLMLALSLYNLIPCCPQCNFIKKNQMITYSPYDESFTTDQLLRFKPIPISADEYSIKIQSQDKIIESNISILMLEDAYGMHKSLVKELYVKYLMYTDDYRKSLQELFSTQCPTLSMSLDEVYYGNYLTEDKYFLRPLSKLTHDIISEIKAETDKA